MRQRALYLWWFKRIGVYDMESCNFGLFSLEEDDGNDLFVTQVPKGMCSKGI